MEFGIIRRKKQPILLEEWQRIIESHPALQQMPDREGVNPITNKRMVFSGEGQAYYLENHKPAGNVSLEDGVLMTTGVPRKICAEIALSLGAAVYADDRT